MTTQTLGPSRNYNILTTPSATDTPDSNMLEVDLLLDTRKAARRPSRRERLGGFERNIVNTKHSRRTHLLTDQTVVNPSSDILTKWVSLLTKRSSCATRGSLLAPNSPDSPRLKGRLHVERRRK